jgi:hypothetical protein
MYLMGPMTSPLVRVRTWPVLIRVDFRCLCAYCTVMAYNGHFYWVASGRSTYEAALDRAGLMTYRGIAGHLVTVTTPGEYNFLYWTMNARGAMIALSNAAPEFQWTFTAGPEVGMRATDANYTLWAFGEPNGYTWDNCVVLDTFGFNDISCTAEDHNFVVEFECPHVTSPPGRCQSMLWFIHLSLPRFWTDRVILCSRRILQQHNLRLHERIHHICRSL